MEHKEKKNVLAALKKAEAEKKNEREVYGLIIKAAMDTPATEAHHNRLNSLSLDDLEQLMAGERWPPESGDWLRIKGLNWDENPKHIQLQEIKDQDIRTATYFYSEQADHALRYKAMAKFFGFFGASSEQIIRHFAVWRTAALFDEVFGKENVLL